jgi:hypothetical protein
MLDASAQRLGVDGRDKPGHDDGGLEGAIRNYRTNT